MRRRLCRLEPGRLAQVSAWVGEYRRFWEESFQRLDGCLETFGTDPGNAVQEGPS